MAHLLVIAKDYLSVIVEAYQRLGMGNGGLLTLDPSCDDQALCRLTRRSLSATGDGKGRLSRAGSRESDMARSKDYWCVWFTLDSRLKCDFKDCCLRWSIFAF
ncbi:hypothetical protein SESBI_29301 [Sesbania bispinosa]|nr:hypothetical protein SESBI_29301 [Sesbania bispinosa]